jgi:hypothetical protein
MQSINLNQPFKFFKIVSRNLPQLKQNQYSFNVLFYSMVSYWLAMCLC